MALQILDPKHLQLCQECGYCYQCKTCNWCQNPPNCKDCAFNDCDCVSHTYNICQHSMCVDRLLWWSCENPGHMFGMCLQSHAKYILGLNTEEYKTLCHTVCSIPYSMLAEADDEVYDPTKLFD